MCHSRRSDVIPAAGPLSPARADRTAPHTAPGAGHWQALPSSALRPAERRRYRAIRPVARAKPPRYQRRNRAPIIVASIVTPPIARPYQVT